MNTTTPTKALAHIAAVARLLGLAAILALLAAIAPSAMASTPPKNTTDPHVHGKVLGVVPPVAAHGKSATGQSRPTGDSGIASAKGAVGNLSYHGGSVMSTNRTHAIYWVPPGSSVSSNYQSLINGFLANVAADSGRHSNVYSTDLQYSGIHYGSTYAGSFVDTNPFPANGCSLSGFTVCLNDQQIRNEIDRLVTNNNWPRGLGDVYFLFTPKGVASRKGDPTQNNIEYSYADYCGYHSSFGSGSGTTLYANLPYDNIPPYQGMTCSKGEFPNGDDADATINILSHEHNEAITDPTGFGWWDNATKDENGDKCAWTFGGTFGETRAGDTRSYYNQVINGHQYYIQLEWSNDDSGTNKNRGCVPAIPRRGWGQLLKAGDSLVSPNAQYTLQMEPDGNLVEYATQGRGIRGRPLWWSGTSHNPGAYASMESNGNLVVRSAGGTPLWSSQTSNYPGAYLTLQSDGNAVVYASDGSPRWASAWRQTAPAGPASGATFNNLMSGESLSAFQYLNTSGYTLQMQDDGNLVEYDAQSHYLWQTGTSSTDRVRNRVTMQGDGNLVVQRSDGQALRWSGTTCSPGDHLTLQGTDGNVVIYASGNGQAVWSRLTGPILCGTKWW